jgi:hypothetical protein
MYHSLSSTNLYKSMKLFIILLLLIPLSYAISFTNPYGTVIANTSRIAGIASDYQGNIYITLDQNPVSVLYLDATTDNVTLLGNLACEVSSIIII